MDRPIACQMPMTPRAKSAVSGFFSQSVVGRPKKARVRLMAPTVGWKANWNTSAMARRVETTGRKKAAR